MPLDQTKLTVLGQNIRRLRVQNRLTQEKLAELAAMDITNLQRIEAGKYNTKILTLIRIRESLDVDWDSLIPCKNSREAARWSPAAATDIHLTREGFL